MDKYRRVPKDRSDKQETPENEIRVTAVGRSAQYVTYGAKQFNEKNADKIIFKATGTALSAAVTSAEILKRRFKGLHQITKLGSTEIVDEYEPLEEGLDKVTDVRQVSFLEIILSKNPLDTKDKGYQEPLSEDLVKEMSPEDMARGRGRRGKGRKGFGKGKGTGRGKSKGGFGKGEGGKSKGGKGKGYGYEGGKAASKGGKGKGAGKSKGGKGKSSYDMYASGGGYGGGYDSNYGGYGGGYDSGKGKGMKGKGFGGFGGKGKSKGGKGKW